MSTNKKERLRYYLGRALLIGAIYALFGFLMAELMVNPLRISRLTGGSLDTVSTIITVINLLLFTGFVVFAVIVQVKIVSGQVLDLFVIVFTLVCLILSIGLFSWLFPMVNPADDPGPGAGMILLFFTASYLIILILSTLTGFVYHRLRKRK